MTTIRELVSSSFRESNLIQVGDVPDGAEYLEAEKRLLSYIGSVWGVEIGENLIHVVYQTVDDTLPSSPRIVITADSPSSLELPTNPQDGQRFGLVDPNSLLSGSNTFTISPGDYTIEGSASLVVTTAGVNSEWFFRADLGDWVKVTPLTSDSESPFPAAFDDLFITWLSMRLNPRSGTQTSAETLSVFNRMLKTIRARYRQKVETASEDGLTRLTGNPRWLSDWARGR